MIDPTKGCLIDSDLSILSVVPGAGGRSSSGAGRHSSSGRLGSTLTSTAYSSGSATARGPTKTALQNKLKQIQSKIAAIDVKMRQAAALSQSCAGPDGSCRYSNMALVFVVEHMSISTGCSAHLIMQVHLTHAFEAMRVHDTKLI